MPEKVEAVVVPGACVQAGGWFPREQRAGPLAQTDATGGPPKGPGQRSSENHMKVNRDRVPEFRATHHDYKPFDLKIFPAEVRPVATEHHRHRGHYAWTRLPSPAQPQRPQAPCASAAVHLACGRHTPLLCFFGR